MQNSILSRKKIKTFWIKFERMLLVVHLSFLNAKQFLMKLSFESLQTYANRLLGLTPANYFRSRYVNPCLSVFIRVGIWIQKRVDSHLDKTRHAALKIWSCLFPTNKTRMTNWKLVYNRRTEENWLFQCWWVLFSLQHCKWIHGLLLPLLSVSRVASFSHWRGYSTRQQKERARCVRTTLYRRERLQDYWNVGVRLVETVQNNQNCSTTYPRTLSLQAFSCSWAIIRRDNESKVIWLRAVRYCTWKLESKLCEFPSNIQEHHS